MARREEIRCDGPGCPRIKPDDNPDWIEGGLWYASHGIQRIEVFPSGVPSKYDPDALKDWCGVDCLAGFIKIALASSGISDLNKRMAEAAHG